MLAGRTDIHFHLLPGVDDGPATLPDAVDLARAAALDGSGTVVATPHVRSDYVTDVWQLRDRVRDLKAALAYENVPVSVELGGELGHDMVGRLHQDELDVIAQGPPGARWLLLETPFEGLTAGVNACADELRDRGFGVVLAHPERSAGLLDTNRSGLDHELRAGSALQVNGYSLAGWHGEPVRRAALRLIELGLVTAIASDAHGGARRPALTLGHDMVVDAGIAPGIARSLVDSGPRRLMVRGLDPAQARATR
jgi:protein-tyrosine phosphatase